MKLLAGLSDEELAALADSILAPSAQNRLDELLEQSSKSQLTCEEEEELDRLLAQVDQLTILKTRARYTLATRACAQNPLFSAPLCGSTQSTLR